MSYIIVWRNSHRDPFVDTNFHGFKEDFTTYEEAKEAAEAALKSENEDVIIPHFFDYQIYEEVTN